MLKCIITLAVSVNYIIPYCQKFQRARNDSILIAVFEFLTWHFGNTFH